MAHKYANEAVMGEISKRQQAILNIRAALLEFDSSSSLQALILLALEKIVDVTGSIGGIFDFIEDDANDRQASFGDLKNEELYEKTIDKAIETQQIYSKYNVYCVPIIRSKHVVATICLEARQACTVEDMRLAEFGADLIWDIIDRKKIQEQLKQIAHYDMLTKLPNRALLEEYMRVALARTHKNSQMLAICLLDVDGLKSVNDMFGFKVGDRLLLELTKRLQEVLREEDVLARIGGDEFALLLSSSKNLSEYENVLKTIIKTSSETYNIDDNPVVISVSIGVTLFPNDGADAQTLLRHADQAMYQAKQNGRNRYHFFDASAEWRLKSKKDNLNKIKFAIESNQMVLYYQPKVDCRRGKVVGFEALIRWEHPILGMIPPGQFLPLIEKDEIGVLLGEWVIKEALRQMREWKNCGLCLPVSVNISSKQLHRKDFFDTVKDFVSKYPALPLEIEIVETAALEDVAIVGELVKKCKTIGIGFSLDDFGTGYSSLAHLKHIGATTLKIDQTFVRGMINDPEDLAIVEGIIGLANAFNCEVVAEGVESIEYAIMLLESGCDVMQGYALSRPIRADYVLEWTQNFKPDPRWKLAYSPKPKRSDFNLLLAEANHRRWMENLLSGDEQAAANLNSNECKFGRWYLHDGKKEYGEYPEYAVLENLHVKLHDVARLYVQSHSDKARQEVEDKSDALIKGLHALRRAVLRHTQQKIITELEQHDI